VTRGSVEHSTLSHCDSISVTELSVAKKEFVTGHWNSLVALWQWRNYNFWAPRQIFATGPVQIWFSDMVIPA